MRLRNTLVGPQVESDKNSLLDRDNPLLVEKFAVIGSGMAECNSCQYLYDPSKGDENYPVPRGVRFEARISQLQLPALQPAICSL